jgi:acyl carrier protein
MTDEDRIRDRLRELLAEVAPDADVGRLDADADLREELDLDSMDVQRLVVALDDELGIALPDRAVPKLRTLDDWTAELARTSAGAPPA